MNTTETNELNPSIIESLVVNGDCSRLSPAQRAEYYLRLCDSLQINALTQPFQFLPLGGKLVLYATRAATDQLAKRFEVSREMTERPTAVQVDKTWIVRATCKASMRLADGSIRSEERTATIPVKDPTMDLMKCETKAARRATLALVGLGMMDETEVEDMPRQAKKQVDARMPVITATFEDVKTEIKALPSGPNAAPGETPRVKLPVETWIETQSLQVLLSADVTSKLHTVKPEEKSAVFGAYASTLAKRIAGLTDSSVLAKVKPVLDRLPPELLKHPSAAELYATHQLLALETA